MDEIRTVESFNFSANEDYTKSLAKQRKPVILKNIDIGPCRRKWTVEYLSKMIGEQEVKVHVSTVSTMSFIRKNFSYKTLSFSDFINRASQKRHTEWFFSDSEYYYLRSIGMDKRGRDVADIRKHFPSIANDMIFPPLCRSEDVFSSVFRISSAGVRVWTHYDIMDNMLIQVVGEKRVILFPPSDAKHLYLNGDKSEVLDIDNPDTEKYPNFQKAQRYECVLKPGDVLFIPALWFHNIVAVTYGISVNVFWKNLPHELYDRTDVYGNKDIVPAAKALNMVEKAVQLLSTLPLDYKHFYIQRAVLCLEKIDVPDKNDVNK